MLSLATKHNDPDAAIGWGERIGYGVGACGWNLINAIIGGFMTMYFTNVALLDAGIIATILAVSKVFDGISDLVIGNIVDRTKHPMGKGRVWLMRMCIPFAVASMLLFWVPSGLPTAVKYVYVFLMYNIANTVLLTFMEIPFFSMTSLITRNGKERGMLGNVQQIFQTLGNVVINGTFVALLAKFSSSVDTENTQSAYSGAVLVFCIIMVALNLITVFFTKERVTEDPEEKKTAKADEVNPLAAVKALLTNKYWVIMVLALFVIFFVVICFSMGSVYYALYIFEDMGEYSWMANSISIAQFAIMFATPVLMQKFDKRWVFTAGMGLVTLGFLGFGLFGSSKILMIFFNVLKGCGLGMASGLYLGIVADVITYGYLRSGINAVGMGNAGVSAAMKLGMGLGTAVFGWVMAAAGFKGEYDLQGIPQPDTVAPAIRMMYTWVPLIMCAVVFVIFVLFYNLERDLAKLRAEKGA